MAERGPGGAGDRDRRGKNPPRRPGDTQRPNSGGGGGGQAPPRRTGGLNLKRLAGDQFELVHPRCVVEMELDYEEGIELWKAGDPEAARDALRYALQGCGDNIWVHNALGKIAFEEFNDPTLARGHYGYAFELAQKAFPLDFRGRLQRDRPANRPYFEAIEGLARCYDALEKPEEARSLRSLAARLIAGSSFRDPQG